MPSQNKNNMMDHDKYVYNEINSLNLNVDTSNNTRRVVNIIKNDHTITQWAVTLGENLPVRTADAILQHMAATRGPVNDMRAELDKLRAMVRRYRGLPALQPADRARVDGLGRLVDASDRMLLRAADMNMSKVMTNPVARMRKEMWAGEGSFLAAVAADFLQEEGDRINRNNLGLDNATFSADKHTLAEVTTLMELWSNAFNDRLFN